MVIRTTLRQLHAATGRLETWCNVYVRLEERPVRVAQQGGRWQVSVRDLAGSASAFICVHDSPEHTGLPLAYRQTAPEPLALFTEPALARLLVPGEVALVQGLALRSQGQLYLNVPAVLL